MSDKEIKHVVKRRVDKVDRTFHIYHDGKTATVKEMVISTDRRTGEQSVSEEWRERQPLVRAGILSNHRDFEAARMMWIEANRMREEKVRDVKGECPVCAGPQEIWVHIFDNDAEQRREHYNFRMCTTCKNRVDIKGTQRNVPYDELEPADGEKEA